MVVLAKIKGEARSREAEAAFVESIQKNPFFSQVVLERESERQGGGVEFEYTLPLAAAPPPYEPLPKFGPARNPAAAAKPQPVQAPAAKPVQPVAAAKPQPSTPAPPITGPPAGPRGMRAIRPIREGENRGAPGGPGEPERPTREVRR
jgi:hypothetical protein